jgi:hypothetical protein
MISLFTQGIVITNNKQGKDVKVPESYVYGTMDKEQIQGTLLGISRC